MQRFSLAAFALLAMLAAPLLTAEAADMIKPGLWENKVLKMVVDGKDMAAQMADMMAKRDQMMASLPPDQRAKVEAMIKSNGLALGNDGGFRICISPEMAKRNTPVIDKEARCQPAKVARSGNRTSFEVNCASNGVTTVGKGTATTSGDVITMEEDVTTTSTNANGTTRVTHMETEMHYLGSDCGDVKPPDAPAPRPERREGRRRFVTDLQAQAAPPASSGLHHSLKQRHMTMIALGGVIGAGLFVGSGVVIKAAGPAAVFSFVITGLLVVLVMQMLGEMAVALPAVGSFYEYARLAWSDRPALGELAGFLTGWMYWYFWVIVVALEAVAGAGLVRFWLPGEPAWLVSLVLLLLLTMTNLVSVRSFGEFEFWFASIKVAAIVVFLAVAAMYVTGAWPGVPVHIANLTAHGGFAPHRILPVLTGAVAATGFYFGAEIVAVAAAEAAEPAKAVAKATNSVITRVLFFYVGSILLVVCLVPWDSAAIATPYVSALSAMGIPAAAHIMNAVVLTAVLSALNSGLYASSRMLFALPRRGDAPTSLARLNRNGVPARAILLGTLFGYAAVIMSYVSPDTVFAFLVNSYGTVAIFVYVLIAISQLRLRARLEKEAAARLRMRMWGYPYLTYLAIAGMLGIVLAMAFIPEQRTPLIFGAISLGLLLAGFCVRLRFGSKPGIAALDA